jgi:hypothetical protein
VYDAVGDPPGAGEHFQGFAVTGLFRFVTDIGCHCCGLSSLHYE